MDKLRQSFIKSLYADEIDQGAYNGEFTALAQDTAFIDSCIEQLEKQTAPEGFSRLAFLLSTAGKLTDACPLWERDIKSKTISWWQHNNYMKAAFQLYGEAAAIDVAETIAVMHPDRKNTWATLGLLIQEDNPDKAVQFMKRDAADNRLTAGFKLNYACALAAIDQLNDAIATVEEAYQERPELTGGFLRITQATKTFPPKTVAALLLRDLEHEGTLPEAGGEMISLLQADISIKPLLEQLDATTDSQKTKELTLFLLESLLRANDLHTAKQLLCHARQQQILMDDKDRYMEETLQSIQKERAQMRYNFCTVITPDYLCYALALNESLLAQNSNAVLHVLICPNGTEDNSAEHASNSLYFYNSDDLCKESVAKKLKDKYHGKYDDGFRWAMKSILMTHLLTNEGCNKVFFADCDIFFFEDFTFLFDELDDCSMIVSPHWKPYSEPGKDKTFIYEEFFYNGLFNAGFVGVSRRGLEHLDWWARACLFNCYKDITHGFFVDQSHLTVLQAHFDGVKILKHRGCNVAHWNERESPRVEQEDGSVLIMDKYPIVFCHFALLCPDRYINGADKLLHAHFWKYVRTLKKHGLTRLRSLFTQFDTQLSSLVWMLTESGVHEVALPVEDKETTAHLKKAGLQINEQAKTAVLVCQKGTSAEAEHRLGEAYTKQNIYTLERNPEEPETEITFVPTATQRFTEVLDEIRDQGLQKILIYGGGMHTPKMLNQPLDLAGLELVGVVDDSPQKSGHWLCGMTVTSAAQAKTMEADAVVVSSDTIEEILCEQAQAHFPKLPVYTLYGGSDEE